MAKVRNVARGGMRVRGVSARHAAGDATAVTAPRRQRRGGAHTAPAPP
eukprot:gene10121-4752_t